MLLKLTASAAGQRWEPRFVCLTRAHVLVFESAATPAPAYDSFGPLLYPDQPQASRKDIMQSRGGRAVRGVFEIKPAQLRRRILEREINVAGALRAQVGDFAADPDGADLFFKEPLDVHREFPDGQDLARRFRREQFAEVPLRFGRFAHVFFWPQIGTITDETRMKTFPITMENLCFICHQVVKARINKGFLEAMDGHCQWKCQQRGGWNHHSPAFAGLRRNFAHNTLTVCDVTGA